MKIDTCDWHAEDTPCKSQPAFLVEWDEGGLEFADFLCDRHTQAMRAGANPFDELGSPPVIVKVTTAESVLASPKAPRR